MIYVDNSQSLKELISVVDSNKEFPFFCDIESTGLDWFLNDILLFQVKIGKEIYVVDVRELGYLAFKELVTSLNKNDRDKVFHNAKFDLKFILDKTGILLNQIYDTMTSEVVLNSGKGKTLYSLAELAEKYADIFMDKDARKEFIDFPKDKPFTESQINYSALDVKVLEPIFMAQWEQAKETRQSQVIVLESELIPIVAQMEYDGILIDQHQWLEVEKVAIKQRDESVEEFDNKIVDFILAVVGVKCENGLELANEVCIPVKTKKTARFLEEITDLTILRPWLLENFNVKSPKQLLKILHLMKVKVKSTNAKTLQEFLDKSKKEYPILKLLLKIRKLNKQIDQYGTNFLKSVHPRTNKIHTEYFTVGTQTGRFSSNNPNLQNVPRKGGYRECFIPEEGFLFAAVDYSQQEYRLSGAVSRELVIINAYKQGSDMHTATASLVYRKILEEISPDERDRGKTVNFAILYGSTEWGLHKNLRIDIEEAKDIIKSFWDGYPKLSKFMSRVGEKILELGYSVTPLGRRRYNLEKPLYANSHEFQRWEERVLREGKNHIIQGGGADILKLAMVELNLKNPYGRNLRPILQIHDELVFMVHKSIAEEALQFIIDTMEEVEQRFLGDIPAKADGKLKERWSK